MDSFVHCYQNLTLLQIQHFNMNFYICIFLLKEALLMEETVHDRDEVFRRCFLELK
jgi:hypothetical protein